MTEVAYPSFVCPRCSEEAFSDHHIKHDVEIKTPGSFCVIHGAEETTVYLHRDFEDEQQE